MPLYIKSPITGEQIQVAENDFSDMMPWDEAMSACEELGNGWRLPSLDELMAMYEQLHKHGKGNFKDEYYWSSSKDNSGLDWSVAFSGGFFNNVSDSSRMRAVRTLP